MSKEIGALWMNTSKAGKKYFAGNIEVNGTELKIVCFKNEYKQNEKYPDFKIYESKPLNGAPKPEPKSTFTEEKLGEEEMGF